MGCKKELLPLVVNNSLIKEFDVFEITSDDFPMKNIVFMSVPKDYSKKIDFYYKKGLQLAKKHNLKISEFNFKLYKGAII